MPQLGSSDLQLTIAVQTALAPAGTEQWFITKATLGNQDASARTVTLYRVPAGGDPDATNIIVPPLSVPAGETLAAPLSGHAFINGQTLQALSSADNVVNLNITYEVVPAS